LGRFGKIKRALRGRRLTKGENPHDGWRTGHSKKEDLRQKKNNKGRIWEGLEGGELFGEGEGMKTQKKRWTEKRSQPVRTDARKK